MPSPLQVLEGLRNGKANSKKADFYIQCANGFGNIGHFLIINAVVIKVYSEFIEYEFKASMEKVVDEDGLENMIGDDWCVDTLRNRFFIFCRDYGDTCKMRDTESGF